MNNLTLVLEALHQHISHPLLDFPLTNTFVIWLARPCQLPLPFPSLGPESTHRLLDLALADWQNYHRTTKELSLP